MVFGQIFRRHLTTIHAKNQKRPEFFCFFALLQVRVPSKNQKNLSFFSFFKVMTKKNQKNSRKTKKKQTWASDQTFSGFLVFSTFRGTSQLFDFSWLLFRREAMGKPKNLEKTKKPKNQNFSENVWSEAHVWFLNVWSEAHVWFFLVFPRVFFSFFWSWPWKN